MNALIVGLGSIAKKHIQAIHELDVDLNIYALRSNFKSEEISNVHNLYSFDEVKKIKWDFVIISNPTSEHKNTIGQILELNCPMFIEKPLYHSLDVEELVELIDNKGVLTYVACNLRFLESLNFVKENVINTPEKINELNIYCGSYLPEWRPGVNYKDNYSAKREMGGGVHLDLIHELDYIYWLFGNPIKVQKTLRTLSQINIDSVDYANYLLEYEGYFANVVLNYYRRDYKRTFEILTENNTWLLDFKSNVVLKNGEVIFQSKTTMLDTYKAQMSYFLNLLKNKSAKSFNSIVDAYNVLKICLDYES